MFDQGKDIGKNVKQLTMDQVMAKVLSIPAIENKIVALNQSQLFDKGLQADGTPTGQYSETSVNVYGKTPGHIKVKDTGAFYASMKVKNESDGVIVDADTMKTVDDYKDKGLTFDLRERWPELLGLTEESKETLNKEDVLPALQDELRNRMNL